MCKNEVKFNIILCINFLFINLFLLSSSSFAKSFLPATTNQQQRVPQASSRQRGPQRPTITISSPRNGESFGTDGQIMITASSINAQAMGAYIDGKQVDRWNEGRLNISYELSGYRLAQGKHTLKITAFNGLTAEKEVLFYITSAKNKAVDGDKVDPRKQTIIYDGNNAGYDKREGNKLGTTYPNKPRYIYAYTRVKFFLDEYGHRQLCQHRNVYWNGRDYLYGSWMDGEND